jgi:uncharacterized membrane protein
VHAVRLTIRWVSAFGAAAAALTVLGPMTGATGGVRQLGLDLTWIQLAYGVFLLLSDMRWMVKLVVCSAGSKRCIARLGNSEARAKVAAPASNTADCSAYARDLHAHAAVPGRFGRVTGSERRRLTE